MAPKRKPATAATAAAAKKKKKEKDGEVDVYDFDAQVAEATPHARATSKRGKKAPPPRPKTTRRTSKTTTAPPALALEFIKGPFKGTQFLNPKNLVSLKIGRVKPGNQIHVKDDAVSQKHAHIFWNTETNQWVIVDLGSSNGTYVDDVELDEHSEASTLRNGSTIKIGNQTTVVVRIRPLEEEEERENAKKKKNNNKNNDNRNEEEEEEEEEEETELVKKKKKGTSKKSVGVATLEAKTKKMPLSASAKGNKKSVTLAGNGTKRTSIRPEVTPSENDDENDNNNNNIADAATKKKKKKKEAKSPPLPLTKTAEEGEAGSRQRVNDDDEDDEKSNETTLERLQRWSSELIEDVRASAERAIERLFREKKKIEADLREEFAV